MTYSFRYPARIKRDPRDGNYLVSFPDLPEALTSGVDFDDAISEAEDCLDAALATRLVRRDQIPPPSRAKKGHRLVSVQLYLAPKVALWAAMCDQHVSRQQLARSLGMNEAAIDRLLDPKKDAEPATVQKALAVLGRSIVLSTEDAA